MTSSSAELEPGDLDLLALTLTHSDEHIAAVRRCTVQSVKNSRARLYRRLGIPVAHHSFRRGTLLEAARRVGWLKIPEGYE